MEENYSSSEVYYPSDLDSEGEVIFESSFHCYPISIINKPHLEVGNKIIMPPSALDSLIYLGVKCPMLFEMEKYYNNNSGRVSHCGVLEFTAEEGNIYVPNWMMENMQLQDGEIVNLKSTNLEKGTFFKLQPHTKDFFDISDPKTILEISLGSFSCLTTGDTIMILHDNKEYYIDVVETKPSHAICVIDTDCEVDFAQSLDYKEPELKEHQEDKPVTKTDKCIPFTGPARRLDGQLSTQSSEQTSYVLKQEGNNKTKSSDSKPSRRTNGKIIFGSNSSEPNADKPRIEIQETSLKSRGQEQESSSQKAEKPKFQSFTGKKYSLKS